MAARMAARVSVLSPPRGGMVAWQLGQTAKFQVPRLDRRRRVMGLACGAGLEISPAGATSQGFGLDAHFHVASYWSVLPPGEGPADANSPTRGNPLGGGQSVGEAPPARSACQRPSATDCTPDRVAAVRRTARPRPPGGWVGSRRVGCRSAWPRARRTPRLRPTAQRRHRAGVRRRRHRAGGARPGPPAGPR
jgi:hypothetical protein